MRPSTDTELDMTTLPPGLSCAGRPPIVDRLYMDITAPCLDTQPVSEASNGADELRDVERRRLQSLLEGDMDVAAQLHADGYQLITPGGATQSKDQYLEGIASGRLDYHVFEAESPVAVRLVGDAGILRYRARIQITVAGEPDHGSFWHTDYYERRHGVWQAVWSQATRIKP